MRRTRSFATIPSDRVSNRHPGSSLSVSVKVFWLVSVALPGFNFGKIERGQMCGINGDHKGAALFRILNFLQFSLYAQKLTLLNDAFVLLVDGWFYDYITVARFIEQGHEHNPFCGSWHLRNRDFAAGLYELSGMTAPGLIKGRKAQFL